MMKFFNLQIKEQRLYIQEQLKFLESIIFHLVIKNTMNDCDGTVISNLGSEVMKI